MAYYKNYLWIFGDGHSSTEKNPVHTYTMAGEYTVVRKRTYVNGIVETEDVDTLIVYVYEWDLTGNHVTYSDQCIRGITAPMQGVGMVEWGGEKWLWPEAYEGACNGHTEENETITLVLDTVSGKFYRIGVEEQWLDRLDNIGYTKGFGHEIESYIKLKENISNQGEQLDILHNESYVHFRPFNEEDRNLPANNPDNGFRDGFNVSAELFQDGQLGYSTKIEKVPLKADYIFPKKMQARRLQLLIRMATSSFRLISVGQRFVELEKKPGPKDNTRSETLWQREFATPDLWISRDSSAPITNRASGVVASGSYNSLVPGPDQYEKSALFFGNADGLSLVLNTIGESTISFWINDLSATDITLFQFENGKSLKLEYFGDGYALVIETGLNTIEIPLGWNGSEWTFIAVSFKSNEIRAYRDKNDFGVFKFDMGNYGGATSMIDEMCSMFDIRRVPRAISHDALNSYYDTIIEDRGDTGYLPVMR